MNNLALVHKLLTLRLRYLHLLSRPLLSGLLALVMLYPVSPVLYAQTSGFSIVEASEARVKAAYLYKFLNYIHWQPASFAHDDSPYTIALINADDIADELTKLSVGRRLNNRMIEIRKLRFGDPVDSFHVLFIGDGERSKQVQLLKQLERRPILTVTDTEGALTYGSVINFRLVDHRVRFEVALEPIEKSGLKLDSRLLAVAITVIKGAQ